MKKLDELVNELSDEDRAALLQMVTPTKLEQYRESLELAIIEPSNERLIAVLLKRSKIKKL